MPVWVPAFAGTCCTDSTQSRRALAESYQVRLKPALRLLERSPVAVSLTEPVTLNGPPNSFCSALSVRSHLSSILERGDDGQSADEFRDQDIFQKVVRLNLAENSDIIAMTEFDRTGT
jgi:hypothetical protein